MNFTVYKPLAGHDEDAIPYADEKMLIVCDGLGGGGQNSYVVDGEKRTSAYLGSRVLSSICKRFFEENYEKICADMKNSGNIIGELKNSIKTGLDRFVAEKDLKNVVKGKSMQMLPSTLAAIVYKTYEDHTDVLVVSAGDSRAYALTPENGLMQISKDDVFENVDAFEKTATMTNNIRQDGDFHINYAYYSLPPKCVLFACTDGCFDYVSTPMEFEYRIEYCISKCGDLLDEEKNALGEYYGDVLVKSGLNDDCTIAGAIVGYEETTKTKELFLQRALEIQSEYRTPCNAFEQESAKRKSEVEPKLNALEKEVDILSEKVETKVKSAFSEIFKYHIRGNGGDDGTVVGELSSALLGYEPYVAFLEESNRIQGEQISVYKSKEEEHIANMKKLRSEYDNARFEEYLKSATMDVSSGGIFNRERTKLIEEYKKLVKVLNASGNEYAESFDVFSALFERYKSYDIRKFRAMEEFEPLSQSFEKMKTTYSGFIAAKDSIRQCRRELKQQFIETTPNLDSDFVGDWNGSFEKYETKAEYVHVLRQYPECIKSLKAVEASEPLSEEKRVENFASFCVLEFAKMYTLIKDKSELMKSLCGDDYVAFFEKSRELLELKEYFDEPNAQKRQLWEKYKVGYEMFVHSVGGSK